jgi:hypothetical protein
MCFLAVFLILLLIASLCAGICIAYLTASAAIAAGGVLLAIASIAGIFGVLRSGWCKMKKDGRK